MGILVTADGGGVEFPDGDRFATEEMFNNLCIYDIRDRLLAVFAQDKWTSVEFKNGDSGSDSQD